MLRSPSLRVLGMALIAIGLRAGTAEAAIITYDNLASWQAAVSGVNTTTFEENASGAFMAYGVGPAVFGGGTYTIDAGQLFTVDPEFDPSFFGLIGTGDVLAAQQGASLLTITGGGVTALAFDFVSSTTGTLSVTLSTGDVIPLAATSFAPGFLGIASTVPITGLTITVLDFLNLDNFRTASAAAVVPEPGSLLLFASGLVALAVRRRLRSASVPR